MEQPKTLKVISLQPSVVVLNKVEYSSTEGQTEEIIVAPFLLDEDKVIEDISELVGTVYEKFSEACESYNLSWEAELELGLEFGVKFSARLKLSPKKLQEH